MTWGTVTMPAYYASILAPAAAFMHPNGSLNTAMAQTQQTIVKQTLAATFLSTMGKEVLVTNISTPSYRGLYQFGMPVSDINLTTSSYKSKWGKYPLFLFYVVFLLFGWKIFKQVQSFVFFFFFFCFVCFYSRFA